MLNLAFTFSVVFSVTAVLAASWLCGFCNAGSDVNAAKTEGPPNIRDNDDASADSVVKVTPFFAASSGEPSTSQDNEETTEQNIDASPKRTNCSTTASITCNPQGGPGLTKQPNILIFVGDDLGHADLSYTEGNLQTPTPHIDNLAWDGIILNRHYTNPICTPTRSAFMTGKYVFRIGMQTAAIADGEPWGVPLKFKFAPQYFKDLGYDTWATGKWHLGQHQRAFFPNARGFDRSYMVTSGDANWFNYTTGWITPEPLEGRMLRENGKLVFANITNNHFLPELFTSVAEKWIRAATSNNPWFLYFATTAPHTAFEDFGATMHTMPQYQMRPSVISFGNRHPLRKKLLGAVQVLDESFKRLIKALTEKRIINNTLIVVFADNGAPIPSSYNFVHGSNWGSNWPLRMGKGTLFEGGVRTSSFIWSPLLPKRGRVTNQLFHVTDWLPTLYEAAGGNVSQLGDGPGDLNGVSHWKSLYEGLGYGPRRELVNNIDAIARQHAMVWQHPDGTLYKLIGGNVFDNSDVGWFRTPGTSDEDPQTVWTPVSVACNNPPGAEVSPCLPHHSDCLFDLTNDPCETYNIAESHQSVLELLQRKLKAYNATSIRSAIRPYDPASNPKNWDGHWAPWKEPSGEVLDNPLLTFSPFYPSSLS